MDYSVRRILTLIKDRGISERQFNIACGLNHSAVDNWKKGNGKPKREMLLKIAKYFDKPYCFFCEEHINLPEVQRVQAEFFEGLTDNEIKKLEEFRDLLIAARKKK